MGEYFQIIADVEATEDQAAELAASVVRWLAGAGIIMAKPSDCVLGAEAGYPPGPNYATAVTHPDERKMRLRTNGVEVCTSRRVFHPVQAPFGPAVCPRCGQTAVLEDPATGKLTRQWEPFDAALNAWMTGGAADVRCPLCGQVASFNDWDWISDWPLAVGFVGFTFWNWPQLSQSFISSIAGHLGHRVVVTGGKM